MSDIDPEKLAKRIAWFREHWVGRNLVGFPKGTIEVLTKIADAAESHLATLPRWKEVEVWRVEWASAAFIPCIEQFVTEGEAKRAAHERASLGRKCVTVTGPHKQRVPQ